MGGDTFQGVQKLTNQEFQKYVIEILQKIIQICERAEPYLPIPQKKVHGDIDFLILLLPDRKEQEIIKLLNINKFRINTNSSINSVYMNKQVDFIFVSSQQQFQITKFYKSYSGLGGYLGLFLPSKQIKLSNTGLYAMRFYNNIKFQFLITNKVSQILQFYGLSPQKYYKGFETRQQLFKFLYDCRFLNILKLKQTDIRRAGKLTKYFIDYLNKQNIHHKQNITNFDQNPKQQTLQYFNKTEQFEEQYKRLLIQIQRKQKISRKFNGKILLQNYPFIKKNEIDEWKNKFKEYFGDQLQYQKYVESNCIGEIVQKFKELFDEQIKLECKKYI